MTRRTLLAAAAAVAGASAGLPATAAADSISYIKDGDVWLATPDGSRHYQVTATGGYSAASQADDGTLIALHGRRLHRLARDGRVLADFTTPVSAEGPVASGTFYGPYDPAISPDGTKVAYSYYHDMRVWDSSCWCYRTRSSSGTGYSHADRMTSWDEPGFDHQSGWLHPSWIDDERVLISEPGVPMALDVAVDRAGDGPQKAMHWFKDDHGGGLEDGEMDRRRTKLAFIGGDRDEQLRIYRMQGEPPELPENCFNFNHSDKLHGPSWSPDGTRLAVADPSGIHVVTVPDLTQGCVVAADSSLVIPGGSEPDWGPADVPPARPAQPGGGAGPGGAQPGGGQPGGATRPGAGRSGGGATAGTSGALRGTGGLRLAIPGTALRTALARGLPVRVRVPRAGTVRLEARRAGRRVAAGSATARRAGTVTVRLRFTRAARRSLARRRAARISVRATLRPRAGAPVRGVRTVTLRAGRRAR